MIMLIGRKIFDKMRHMMYALVSFIYIKPIGARMKTKFGNLS